VHDVARTAAQSRRHMIAKAVEPIIPAPATMNSRQAMPSTTADENSDGRPAANDGGRQSARGAGRLNHRGLRGYVFLYWLHIDVLWVDEAARTAGLGSELLEQAETKAKSLGAHSAKLDTFEWQAPDFYAKRGYQEFGRIDNRTNGLYLAFMMKKL